MYFVFSVGHTKSYEWMNLYHNNWAFICQTTAAIANIKGFIMADDGKIWVEEVRTGKV